MPKSQGVSTIQNVFTFGFLQAFREIVKFQFLIHGVFVAWPLICEPIPAKFDLDRSFNNK